MNVLGRVRSNAASGDILIIGPRHHLHWPNRLAASLAAADTVAETSHEVTRQAHRASLVLVLGIMSLSVCAPLGIVAWGMGRNDRTAMRSGRMDRSGEVLIDVGKILGILGTMLSGLGTVGELLWLTVGGLYSEAGEDLKMPN